MTDSPPLWVENPNTLLRSSWSEHTFQNHRHSLPINGIRTNGNEHHSACTTPTTRLSRLAFDGQLATVRDVIEENSENADEPNMMISTNNDAKVKNDKEVKTDLLVDLEIPNENSTSHNTFKSSHTISDFATQAYTPCIENRELPHSISHSSGYHSFTEEENGSDSHREFAGCLNTSASRKLSLKCRDLELKTFSPGEQSQSSQNSSSQEIILPPPPVNKERARSLDRASQRKMVRSYPSGGSITPTILMSTSIVEDSFMSSTEQKRVSRSDVLSTSKRKEQPESTDRRWSRSPANSKLEQHQWQLCLYMFGGREQGAPGIYRQPISIWKLYV